MKHAIYHQENGPPAALEIMEEGKDPAGNKIVTLGRKNAGGKLEAAVRGVKVLDEASPGCCTLATAKDVKTLEKAGADTSAYVSDEDHQKAVDAVNARLEEKDRELKTAQNRVLELEKELAEARRLPAPSAAAPSGSAPETAESKPLFREDAADAPPSAPSAVVKPAPVSGKNAKS